MTSNYDTIRMNYKCKKGQKNPDTNECLDNKTVRKDEYSDKILKTSNVIDLVGPIYYKNDHHNIQKFRNTVSKDDIGIVSEYVGKGEPEINSYLRNTKIFSVKKIDKMENHKKVLDGLVSKYTLSEDKTLFRGANHPKLYELNAGDVIVDPAFQSTTENINWTEFFINQPDNNSETFNVSNPVLFVIRAKKGQNAAPLSAIKSPHQGEFLLPRETPIRIDKVMTKGKLKIMEASIIKG